MSELSEELQKRAQLLAQKGERELIDPTAIHVLTFRLGKERYALEIGFAKSIHPFAHCQQLPGTPPFVMGVITVRQQIISVTDLRYIFSLPIVSDEPNQQVLIVSHHDLEFGLCVDEVFGTEIIRQKDLQPPPGAMGGAALELLLGLTEDKLIVINGEALLQRKDLVVDQAIE